MFCMDDTHCRQDRFLLFISRRLFSFRPQLTAMVMHAIGALQMAASVSTWLHVDRDLPSGCNSTVQGLDATVNRQLPPASCKQCKLPCHSVFHSAKIDKPPPQDARSLRDAFLICQSCRRQVDQPATSRYHNALPRPDRAVSWTVRPRGRCIRSVCHILYRFSSPQSLHPK